MTVLRIKNLLVKHGQEHMRKRVKIVEFTSDPDCDSLLNDLDYYPHAFIIACVMDRQIKAELAWSIPYRLSERIGDFEFPTLYHLKRWQLRKYLNNPTPLHRYTEKMSEYLFSAIQIIGDEYNGDASNLWAGKPSSADVVFRLLKIHGVGPKIATMATNILARNFKIKFKDYYSIDISADVHVKRVFYRLGLSDKKASIEQVIYKARALNPEFPGLLDFPCWEIGRNWCRPKNMICKECYMKEVCPSSNV